MEKIQLFDIRQGEEKEDLREQIIQGLQENPKQLPSVLLWDDIGQRYFDDILMCPEYYPASTELHLLQKHASQIASSIRTGDLLIELGAGNLRKTAIVLRALELQDKHVQYYALDVSPSILEKSLFDLQMQFPAASNITIHGLVGTYEDCAYWLKHSKPECQKSVLWLGNSIANFEPQEAENLISTFCGSLESDASPVNMIIAADGCRDEMQMRRAYAMVGGQSRKFVLNGLYHANRVLGADHFKIRDWGFASQWNPNSWMYESFVVAEKDLILTIDGEKIYIKRGERIRAIGSGKWPNAKIDSICRGANVQIFDCWLNNNASYGLYLIRQPKF